MKLLAKVQKELKADEPALVTRIQGQMTYFPLCCSTGVLNNLTAQTPTKGAKPTVINLSANAIKKIKSAKYIHEIVRAATSLIFPIEVAQWNALSLCLLKAVKGKDDSGDHAYGNYKCAQITMCDRIVADKRDKRFKFSSYNTVFSVDQFMDFLDDSNNAYGEFYSSPPVPGGHGARVRAGIFTPDKDALQKFHDEHIEEVREYVLKSVKKSKSAPTLESSW